jgi:hypothetical protein
VRWGRFRLDGLRIRSPAALLNAVASWPIFPSSSATSSWFEVGRLKPAIISQTFA